MVIQVKVTPGARENKVVSQSENLLKVRVTSPPDKGKANQAVIDLLSKHFNLPKRCIIIKSGHASRTKQVIIDKE